MKGNVGIGGGPEDVAVALSIFYCITAKWPIVDISVSICRAVLCTERRGHAALPRTTGNGRCKPRVFRVWEFLGSRWRTRSADKAKKTTGLWHKEHAGEWDFVSLPIFCTDAPHGCVASESGQGWSAAIFCIVPLGAFMTGRGKPAYVSGSWHWQGQRCKRSSGWGRQALGIARDGTVTVVRTKKKHQNNICQYICLLCSYVTSPL